ncbi:M56 family metallopeptidase [Empedobacter tilapiae]|uniref:M56 family metallopeptidase n=1 Tax=Empedobacter tilapiae TaxID=2491114 RepID=UPI0028D67ABE|nr:M56 family metallopeptidase [Empedobacter tilapiae]
MERESMYKINRFYLLFSLIFSLMAPLYKIDLPITATEANISPELLAFLMQNPELLQQEKGVNFGDILNVIYILVGVIFLVRFIYNLYELMFKIKTEEKIKDQNITYILDLDSNQPYSFWKYIFIPEKQLKNLHQNLIDHEKAHCIQKHSLDILLIEIFQILFWFNPFVYFYKKSIKLNHEFLADEYVLKKNSDLKTYQYQILDCIATQNPSMMASNFNFILTKKRLLMMTKNTSKRKVKILSFASLPFILSAFVLFSQKSFAQEVEKKAQKVEQALEKPVQSQAETLLNHANKLSDSLLKTAKIEDVKKADQLEKILTKDELKNILKSNPQNKIILNDAGDIILNDSIKIKDIVLRKDLVPTILYGTDRKVLQKIDPKEIDKMFVKKNEGLIEIIKKDSSVIKIFNLEKNIPNIDKKNIGKTTPTKMLMITNNITFKDGLSIYTDKNGVEHKIQNSEIDKIYITKNKNGITESKEFDMSKFPKTITSLKINKKNDNDDDVNITVLPKNGYSYNYTFTKSNQPLSKQLDLRMKELKLQEENTKKQIKEIERLQKEERKNNK